MRPFRAILTTVFAGAWLAAGVANAEKTHSVTVTAAMRSAAQKNVARYDWAKRQAQGAVKNAARWLAMSDADLWSQVTPQSLPRTIHTTLIRGTNRSALCPKCREGIVPFGNYPWRIDAERRPWKLECPNCRDVFPKNDFWAYYRSALDEHGKFQPGAGDRRLLFNAEHPDPNDPLHTYGVDDGYGWFDAEGTRWAFAAYYNSWGQWAMIYRALDALVNAYLLTDDVRCAHKAGVLLDRIADVYPEMDTYRYIKELKFEHSDGSSGRGRIEGQIWETRVAMRFALAYDRVYDGMAADATLVEFLAAQSKQHRLGDKRTFAAIQRNIEEHLLLEIVKGVERGQIHGNEGMHQVAMAAAAIALDRQPQTNTLLDWVFQPGKLVHDRAGGGLRNTGGNVPFVLMNSMDRDGMGSEGAPGYSCWGLTMLPLAELLNRYPAYTRYNLFHDFPKYKQCFLTPLAWACLGQVTPPIGDSGACGAWGAVGPGRDALMTLTREYRDPRLARRLLQVAHGKPAAVPYDIFADDPPAQRDQILRIAAAPPPPLESVSLNGFGLAILQTPHADEGRALWMYYGRNTGHGHRDRLNLGLYAKNVDMLPDLGYPEYASGRPKDQIWERNAIAHNVVIVNDEPQAPSYTGRLRLFDAEGPARVVEVESPGVFRSAQTYRRLTALVEVSERDSYAVDFFCVRGGAVHRQSWHGPSAEVAPAGLTLVAQEKGTFAGENVALDELPAEWRDSPGYMYLYDVRRDRRPPAAFSFDYLAESRGKRPAAADQPHLRLICLTQCNEVALAHGDPPQNKKGNPRRLAYAVLSREGNDLASLFTTIIEPYAGKPLVASARLLPLVNPPPGLLAAAVEVVLADGRVDTVVCCEEPGRVTAGDISLDGTFAVVARRNGQVEFAKLVAGTRLTAPGLALTCPAAFVAGKVRAVNADQPADNRIAVDVTPPPGVTLVGRLAVFANDGLQDAAYIVRGLIKEGDHYQMSTGENTIVRGYAKPADFAAGYSYNVRPGDDFRIPMSARFERETARQAPQ